MLRIEFEQLSFDDLHIIVQCLLIYIISANGREKNAVRANGSFICERLQAHAFAFFPQFRAVREANKQNEGETRATFRSALMSKRVFCGFALKTY